MISAKSQASENLLLNASFRFLSLESSRCGEPQTFRSGAIPFWDQDGYGDAEVFRGPGNPVARTTIPVDGVVVLHPGKSIRQFQTLSEMGMDPGDSVTVTVKGHQTGPRGVRAIVRLMQVDNESGGWTPADFGQSDTRKFPQSSRGEMVSTEIAAAESDASGAFEIGISNIVLTRPGAAKNSGGTRRHIPMGIEIEFVNTSASAAAIYAPTLSSVGAATEKAGDILDAYRHLPRTIAKLRRGDPLHVIVMGSSIDRGSANPPMYRYDENPDSPTYKRPLSREDFLFDGQEIWHPEWTPYFGQWKHFFSCAGRLRRALMRRYNYPINKLLFNFMACDGSSIGESHSALAEWAGLCRPPEPEENGHRAQSSWEVLYPALMARPEGARPDLVIFGSGANEKIDGPEEIAAFEGALRWFQRHFPGVEFLFSMWQQSEAYTPNTGMLKELSLLYGIPFVDVGRSLHLVNRHVDALLLAPDGGYPQAAAHDLWARYTERVFQPADPVAAGLQQQFLPERASPYTIGWEGEMTTYSGDSPRLRKGTAFLLDETVVSVWANTSAEKVEVFIDGRDSKTPELNNDSRLVPMSARNPRNSTFVIGCLEFGKRHILEVSGPGAQIIAVDAKSVLNRTFHSVASVQWNLPRPISPFASEWGAPYGSDKITLHPGERAVLSWIGTDCSIAWCNQPGGGELVASIEGREKLRQSTGRVTSLQNGEELYMEDRAAILKLPFGVHVITIEAARGLVDLLGLFSYDTRPNLAGQRIAHGSAAPRESVRFNPPFRATPVLLPSGLLKVESVSPKCAVFAWDGEPGNFQAIGEY